MPTPSLTPEQKKHLDDHAAGIGHNQGPPLLEHAEKILEAAARHHHLRGELNSIRVMFDMLRSTAAAEYPLPAVTVGYLAACLGVVCAITVPGIAVAPIPALLLDAPVVAVMIATLRGEIDSYIDWRAARDPSYRRLR